MHIAHRQKLNPVLFCIPDNWYNPGFIFTVSTLSTLESFSSRGKIRAKVINRLGWMDIKFNNALLILRYPQLIMVLIENILYGKLSFLPLRNRFFLHRTTFCTFCVMCLIRPSFSLIVILLFVFAYLFHLSVRETLIAA